MSKTQAPILAALALTLGVWDLAGAQTSPRLTQLLSTSEQSDWASQSGSPEDMKRGSVAAFQGGPGVVAPGAVGAAESNRRNLTLSPGEGKKTGPDKAGVPSPEPGKPAGKTVSPALIYGGSALLGGLQGALSGSLLGALAGGGLGLATAYFAMKGDYGAAFGIGLGSILGTFFGGPIGGIIGAAVGGVIGHFVGRLFQ
jgi:hypothetical protein